MLTYARDEVTTILKISSLRFKLLIIAVAAAILECSIESRLHTLLTPSSINRK